MQHECICGLTFAENKYLNRHCMSFLRTFECSECFKIFTQNYNLRKHHKLCHSEISMPEKLHQKRVFYKDLSLHRQYESVCNGEQMIVDHRSVVGYISLNGIMNEFSLLPISPTKPSQEHCDIN